jgi:hypothetical protein
VLASIRSYDLPIQIWVVISPFREEIEKPEAYLKVIFRTEHAVSPCFCGPQREVYSPLSSVGLGVADTASFGALPGNVLQAPCTASLHSKNRSNSLLCRSKPQARPPRKTMTRF